MDRVGGVRDQRPIAGLEHGQRQVGEPLLGADGRDGLGVGIQVDSVAGPVPGGEPADERAVRCLGAALGRCRNPYRRIESRPRRARLTRRSN